MTAFATARKPHSLACSLDKMDEALSCYESGNSSGDGFRNRVAPVEILLLMDVRLSDLPRLENRCRS